MKLSWLLSSLLLLALAPPLAGAVQTLEVGAPAPPIELPDLGGEIYDLQAHAGEYKAVVVLFWGVWCPYCRELMVNLKKMYAELKEQGLEVLAVSMRESPHKVRLFADKLKPGFPVLVDEWASLKDAYHIRDVPRVVIMNRDLQVQATRITTSVETMKKMVQAAMQ